MKPHTALAQRSRSIWAGRGRRVLRSGSRGIDFGISFFEASLCRLVSRESIPPEETGAVIETDSWV